jgi:homoserine kinase type II
MEFVYLVEHVYSVDEIDRIKTIGIFSTRIKAQEAVNQLRYQPGFRDHPKKAFLIGRVKIDRIGWTEGFCSSEETIAEVLI